MENYNLNLQHQLASKVTLQVGYVGSQGHRLFQFTDISQPSQATITASDLANGVSSYGVPRVFDFPYGSFYIMREQSTAKSNYNALQTSLRVNGWRGITSIVYHKRDPFNYVQLSSFAIPCTVTAATGSASDCIAGTRHFGNERRNSLIGPDFRQWDFAVYKTTAITERLNMQLRAEFFNILNHPNFASPFLPLFIADPGVNGFAASGSREVGVGGFGLGATGDVGIGNPFLGGGGPRGIQLAAKFTF